MGACVKKTSSEWFRGPLDLLGIPYKILPSTKRMDCTRLGVFYGIIELRVIRAAAAASVSLLIKLFFSRSLSLHLIITRTHSSLLPFFSLLERGFWSLSINGLSRWLENLVTHLNLISTPTTCRGCPL